MSPSTTGFFYKTSRATPCPTKINILQECFNNKITRNTSLAAPGALAHRLQRRTACNTSPPTLSKMADGVRE